MKINIAENNFDLIRLLAATQVAFLHVLYELSGGWGSAAFAHFVAIFPGVPIFFFISGFLISRSYERTHVLGSYFRNRALRIFPALHICVFLNLVMVYATGYFSSVDVGFLDVALLYFAKTTFLQFYNPDFMRHFGDGVLNGSLWTICVELQFYLLTPVIYKLLSAIGGVRHRDNLLLALFVVLSLLFNRWLYTADENHSAIFWKLARVSFLPWLYMFLCGVIVQRNFEFFSKLLFKNTIFVIFPVYVLFGYVMRNAGFSMNNSISPLLVFPLMLVVFVGAFSFTGATSGLLKGNDISYGVYIYHVPIMNMFIYYGLKGSLVYTFEALAVSFMLAIASWMIIEKPSLHRKRRTARPIP